MQLHHEMPDFAYAFRATEGGRSVTLDDRVLVRSVELTRSFVVAPDALVEEWQVGEVADLSLELLEPVLRLNPELVILATGKTQVFPSPAVMAACLGRGIGLEVMNNQAGARTFNLLASEGRKVVGAFILAG